MLLLGGMASVTAYHIDAAWVPIDPTTVQNTACPATHNEPPGGAEASEAGTDCPNNNARGWAFNPNGLFTVCEQNRAAGGGQAAVNGMCFASNVKYSYVGAAGAAGTTLHGHRGPQGELGGGNVAPGVAFVAPAFGDWTRFWIFSNTHPFMTVAGPCTAGPLLNTDFDATNPHDDVAMRGPAPVAAYVLSPLIAPAAGAGSRCVPRPVGIIQDAVAYVAVGTGGAAAATGGGNIMAQVRACSNTHGLLLTDPVRPPPGTLNPAVGGPFATFLYREIIPFYGCGGHVTFFVQAIANPGAAVANSFYTTDGTTGGSYWAEDNLLLVAGVATMTAPAPAVGALACNQMYDVTDSVVVGGPQPVRSYFDIFEPVTYSGGPLTAWNTACRDL